MNQAQYRLYLTDGYDIHQAGIFSSLEKAQTAMHTAYNLRTPEDWLSEYKELSSINDTDAILYVNGEDVFVWHIEEIQLSDFFPNTTDKLVVPFQNGNLVATISPDPNYPGIDVEYIDNNDNGTTMSRPRVLIEQPVEDNETQMIRCLIWNNPNSEDYTEDTTLYQQTNTGLIVHDHLCDDTMIGIEDENHQLYEYHTDDDEVVIFSRFDEDPGEVITGPTADKIRKFALSKMMEQPHRWKSPVDYKFRCADCAALVEKNKDWVCDECNKPCKEVFICPEGLPNPILAPDTLLAQYNEDKIYKD